MAKKAPDSQSPANPTPSKSVLIVEDEDALGHVLLHKCQKSGFAAQRSANGREALVLLGKQLFDVILLDLLMPGVDGYTVLADLRSTINKKTPVFVLTNLGGEEVCAKVKKLGAKNCFLKSSTSLTELMDHMQKALAT